MCNKVLGVCDVENNQSEDLDDWIMQHLDKKTTKNGYVDRLYAGMKTTQRKSDLIKIAMISGLNVDYGYIPGALKDCPKSVCCRANSG